MKKRLIFMGLIILALLAGGVFAARYDSYQQGYGAQNWHLKLNQFIVEDVGTDIDGTYTLYNALGGLTENIPVLCPSAPTYVDADTFMVGGDYSDFFTVAKVVWAYCGADGMKYSAVAGSSYAGGTTTVDLNDAVLTANLAQIYVVATRDGLWPYGPGYVVARDYGAPSQATLQTALAFIGSAPRTLRLGGNTGTWTISDKQVFPPNVNLQIDQGAQLEITIPNVDIAGLSRANPCVVTWTGHGLDTGDIVRLQGITQSGGWTALIHDHQITKINDDSFSIPVNTSGYTEDYVPASDPGTYTKLLLLKGTLEAGPYQIFSGTGAVALRNGQPAYVEWFGAVGDDSTDDYGAIQKTCDSQAPGGQVIFLGKTYKLLTEVLIQKSITIEGVLGRYGDAFDSGFSTTGGGTVLHQQGLDQNTLRVSAAADTRIYFQMEDICLRGALISPGGATSGKGLVLETAAGSSLSVIHYALRNIQVSDARDEGIYANGLLFGDRVDNVSVYWTGKTGIYLKQKDPGNPIGEQLWTHTRIMRAGQSGVTALEKAGLVIDAQGGNIVFNHLESTTCNGAAAILSGGSIKIDSLCAEGNNLATTDYIIGIGGLMSNTLMLNIDNVYIAVPSGYAGTLIKSLATEGSYVDMIALRGLCLDTGTGLDASGYHFGTNAFTGRLIAKHIKEYAAAAIKVDAAGAYNKIEGYSETCDFGAKLSANVEDVTGDGTVYAVVWDTEDFDSEGTFSTSTGLFTAPSDGKYHFETTILLLGLAAGNTSGNLSFLVDGGNGKVVVLPNPGAVMNGSNQAAFSAGVDLILTKGQTVGVAISVSGGTKVVDVGGTLYSYFTGHRVF